MTRNKGLEFGINSLVIICLIFSLFTPSIAYASPSQIALPDSFLENTTDSEDPVSSSIETPTNNEIPLSSQSLNTAQSDLPPEPKIENIGFKVLPATNLITVNQPFIVYVEIQNNTQGNIGKIQFSDVISSGFEFVKSADDVVSYNIKKQEINYSVEKLTPDEIITFSYQLKLTSKLGGDILIHSASLTRSGVSKSIQATWTATTNTTAFNQGSKIAIAQTESGWYDLGTVSLFTNTGDISTNSILASTTITGKKDGPTKQYKFEVFQTQVVSRNSNGTPNNQKTVLSSKQNTSFKDEAFIKFKFDGVVNLSKIPAGFEPYVAVYDESAKIWVKVPIVDANYSENTVTVGAKHFSVWGIGLGTSLPQNGAGALLFDQPYTALFSGASHYEIPIWTPAGRNGLAPQISLSYSSKTADGILGDVQAPWVGMGWNIDDIEIVRKITTDANGYGYSNSFALTLNGKLYKLIRDTQNLSRYYVVEDGFMYIERHNFMLGNEQGVDNTTGEW